MKKTLLIAVAIGAILTMSVVGALAKSNDVARESRVPDPGSASGRRQDLSATRLETLWIFDADFSTTTDDNAGWTGFDRSGVLGQDNHWHHDTLRRDGHTELGDSTWWCGTYNVCWRQERGYGNDWVQILERHVTEAADSTGTLTLEFDQRFAMEKDYDYGYVDVRSSATSDTWYTVQFYTNFGFAGTPGMPTDWGSAAAPDQTIDISAEGMGLAFDLRFRFVSDAAYSSQDQYNNAANSVKDGAWQLDNIALKSNGTPIFTDDAESYGQNGWVTDDLAPQGQTGVTFYRGQFGVDFITGRSFTCDDRPVGSWMYGATSPGSGTMVDDQYSWLMSPPIDVSGAAKLVGLWDMWVDLPRPAEDIFNLWLASNDLQECVTDPAGFVDEESGWWYGGPFWGVWVDDWDAFAGNDWLAILWGQQNDDVPEADHMAGIFLNRQKVGVPSGDAGTAWEYADWYRFNDWFEEQVTTEALLDSATINVKDDDDVATVNLVATNGITTTTYSAIRVDPQGNDWTVPPPATEMTPGSEIHYYFEAYDGIGNYSTYPSTAPDNYYEISILPIVASYSDPGILLVDKHGRRTPSRERDYFHSSEYYYREMLEILGYEWDTYDVEVPSGSTDQSDGPDTMGYKYYDTMIWFTDEFDAYTIKGPDQERLIAWLGQAPAKDRNLLITGNDWGSELMEAGKETLSFYTLWMASDFVSDGVGAVTVDSIPAVVDAGNGFLTYDDAEFILRGGCPQLHYYDVLDPNPSITSGTSVVANYKKLDTSELGAGVAYTHASLGYKTVNLGFGMEFIADGTSGGANYEGGGYFKVGLDDRVNLMANIMTYFGQAPTPGYETGIGDGAMKNALSHAYPNPFNPVTKIAYSVKEAGPVTIEVYNVAGKVVRTLLDTEVDAGASGYVVWDGSNDAGKKCASGVYFYRIAAPGFSTSRKMIMLK